MQDCAGLRKPCLTSVPRDLQIETLKREVETLRAELEKIKLEVRGCGRGVGSGEGGHPHAGPAGPPRPSFLPPQAQRYITQLKGQANALEAELEEQRTQKQRALVDSEQLRHELAQLRAAQQEGERKQGLREAEAESACGGGGGGPVPWRGAPPCSGVTASPLACREGQCHGGTLHQAEGAAQQAGGHARRAAQEGRAGPRGRRRWAGAPNPVPDCALVCLCRTQTRPSS